MRSAFALSVAALAGSAIAAPSYGHGYHKQVKNVHVVVETVVHTVYLTEGAYEASVPKPTYSKKIHSKAPVTTTVVYSAAPAPTTSSVYVAPPAPTSEAPKPTTTAIYTPAPKPTTEAPATISEAAAPAPTAAGYMGIVEQWRVKLGLSKLECDSKLEANALNVVVSGNGVMKHKLNPGTFGQVLAQGDANDFEHVFVGGWLCEIPTLPGLDGVCSKMSQGWSYEGQTGHAEILVSDSYSKIGCQNHQGIWCCDLA